MAAGLDKLDNDVLHQIAASLDLKSLVILGRVNKRLQELVREDQLWQGIYRRLFDRAQPSPSTGGSDTWREVCKKEHQQARLWGAPMIDWGKLMWDDATDEDWMRALMPGVPILSY